MAIFPSLQHHCCPLHMTRVVSMDTEHEVQAGPRFEERRSLSSSFPMALDQEPGIPRQTFCDPSEGRRGLAPTIRAAFITQDPSGERRCFCNGRRLVGR
ncbi:hypothetical protein SKAU_G00364260 [Synaphobranchus kaupii]|uniref:Uncharacterized protein n=1 Tax=Synaphobranchus kaupii TaxID=118154 RepID=A0A9Q1EER9_SYNKA|nr:hypothetical protein SKAU_G00364260 [Synaphobranchus kaupii]